MAKEQASVGKEVRKGESEHLIKEMPSKEMLEEFLDGLDGPVTVYFDLKEGKFKKVIGDGND